MTDPHRDLLGAEGTEAFLRRFTEAVVSRGGRVAIGDVRWIVGTATRS